MLHFRDIIRLLQGQRAVSSCIGDRDNRKDSYARYSNSAFQSSDRAGRKSDLKGFRFIAALIAVIAAVITLPCLLSADALDSAAEEELEEIRSGINEKLSENSKDSYEDILGDFKIDVGDPDSISDISVGSILSGIVSLFLGDLSAPAGMLGRLLAAAVLCTLVQSLSYGRSDLTEVYRMLGSLAAVLAVADCLSECITVTVDCLNAITVFMLSYIPVFAGITSASGSLAAGTGFYGTNLFLCECITFAAKSVLAPMLSILTAVSAVGAINPDIKLGKIAAAVKKAIYWVIGILMTVFTGVLTIQNAVGSAADSARTKVIRFAASSFIPIIGGSVSETYSAVRGSLGVIKAGTGSIGVIIIALIVLKPVIHLLAARAVLFVGKLACGMLGQDNMEQFADSVGSILAIATSIMIAVSIMFIISTCIIMMTATHTGV